MKLQTYKMFVGEDTVYVERDDVLKLLEQEPVIDKVKQAREEIQKLVDMCGCDTVADLNMKSGLGLALEKIDKLIESEGKE